MALVHSSVDLVVIDMSLVSPGLQKQAPDLAGVPLETGLTAETQGA